MKKTKARARKKEVSAEERFNMAADRLFAIDDPNLEAIFKEPIPEWLKKLTRQLARNFSPDLKEEDLKQAPWSFNGYCAAAGYFLAKMHLAIDYSCIPRKDWLEALRLRFKGKGILELNSENELFTQLLEQQQKDEAELTRIRETVLAAFDLPLEQARDFFVAFGDGLKRRTAQTAMDSLSASNTVKICLFVISLRAEIERGTFKNLTEVIDFYFYLGERKGDIIEGNQAAMKEAFIAQFRRICSEAGLKLSGRGRPRKAVGKTPLSSGK